MTRVVSWNMDHWRRRPAQRTAAWEYLRGLAADYALLQETVPPEDVRATHRVYKEDGIAGRGRWGSAVVSFSGPIRKVAEVQSPYGRKGRLTALHRTVPGSLAVAEAGKDLLLVSAYGAFEDGYTVTTVHRLLSDLTPLLDGSTRRGVVVAGDLNVSTQWLGPHRPRHRNVLERFATLGLIDCLALQRPPRPALAGCPCEDKPCRHVQTLRHPRSRVPWQTDYVFVNQRLAKRIRSCFVADVSDPDAWRHSDHCPVVLELAD